MGLVSRCTRRLSFAVIPLMFATLLATMPADIVRASSVLVNKTADTYQGLCVLEKNLIPASLHCDGEGCLARIAVAFPEHPALSEAAPPLHRNGEGAGG